MQEKELLFVGKITAGVTHEINNVLAVIRESSGLMGDILTFRKKDFFSFLKKKDEEEVYREKFMEIISTIGNQVSRGVKLIKSLNRFAHSMDEPLVLVDLNSAAELVAFLMQRFVRPKRVSLLCSPSKKPVNARTNLLNLQMVLSSLIEYHLGEVKEGGQIILSPAKTDHGATVEVLALDEPGKGELDRRTLGGPPDGLDDLQDALEALKGSLAALSGPGLRGTLLSLPGEE